MCIYINNDYIKKIYRYKKISKIWWGNMGVVNFERNEWL